MRVLRHPQEVAQMPFIWGNIYATPPGDYNSFKSHSLYIKNIEGDVSQGVVSTAEKQQAPLLLNMAKESHPCALPLGAGQANPDLCFFQNAGRRWVLSPQMRRPPTGDLR
jgi:hypothetical protein